MGEELNFRAFFEQLTGFKPNGFQERVAEALLAERNVILCAPTGSGKTWAIVAPFLYALHCGKPIGDRLLYALPLRSLATSLYETTKRDAHDCELTAGLSDRVRIQSGEQRDDKQFEGLVTFTTIDQLLSGYLLHPVGLPKRLGNINAGAILGSLVCFDEFHLLDPGKSMATAIEMLDTLAVSHGLSRFVLMTATLSTRTLKWLETKLRATLIEVSEAEATTLPSQVDKTRYYRWVPQPLSAEAVARVHGGRRSIVIANTVSRAQQLFEELRGSECRAILGDRTQIRLLHSRFFPKDRKWLEQDLLAWFRPNPSVTDVILVATQVIEAGLDFSCDNLHTEVAPMNAVIQRAGRCARRRGESGTVWCYALLETPDGGRAFGPYQDGLSELVDSTANVLEREFGASPLPQTFHDELRLVNEVHTEWELRQLRPLENLYSIRKRVRETMDAYCPSAVRELVRDVASINVVITNDPDSLRFNRREWPEMLSVPPTSLMSLFAADRAGENGWIAKAAREEDVFEGGELKVAWDEISTKAQLKSAGWLVAIHPDHATYDADLGLVVGRGGPALAVEYRDRPARERYSYQREKYLDHIRRVRSAGAKKDPDYAVATRRLATLLHVDESQIRQWLDLAYALHDVGKLSVAWQEAIWKSQQMRTGPEPGPRPPLAHSDYDPAVDRGPQPTRPPHAAEGAYACAFLIQQAFSSPHVQSLWNAALTAITRHHGTFAGSLSSFQLRPDSAAIVADTLGRGAATIELLPPPSPTDCKEFQQYLVHATDQLQAHYSLMLYLYLVRRLRLADQSSFEEK